MTTTGARGAITSPASVSFWVTTPATGDTSTASFNCSSSEAIAAAVVAMRAWATSTSSRRAPTFTRATTASAAATRLTAASSRASATARRVAASSRCFCEPDFRVSSRSKRCRSAVAASTSAWAAGTSALAASTCASAWCTSSLRTGARTRRSWASADACSVLARAIDSDRSVASIVSTRAPTATRSPSFTSSVSTRPPISGASRTSVASTWPDTRKWLGSVGVLHAVDAARAAPSTAAVNGRYTGRMSIIAVDPWPACGARSVAYGQ